LKNYQTLADTVIISHKNKLVHSGDELKLIGTGRSAFVFRIEESDKVIKVFYPQFVHVAKEETDIYQVLQGISYFPTVYNSGPNYIVMDFIEGATLFECLTKGKFVTSAHIKEIDYALSLAAERGLNPSDIHLRNILITPAGDIKMIDVARFRQKKDCTQWHDLKKAYRRHYLKPYFPKKIPAPILNALAFLYKKELIPTY
jgi:predicted Ser/Thr protein kinase